MKIAIIGTVGLPAAYGGFETLADNLVKQLGPHVDYRFSVYCSGKATAKSPRSYHSAELIYIPLPANGILSIAYDVISLLHAVLRKADVLLVLGVSGCIALPLVRAISKGKIITNIDGIEWKRDKWNKLARTILKLSEKIAVRFSDAIITDNKAICDYVEAEYGIASELIEYGADHTHVDHSRSPSDLIPYSPGGYAIKVCRIEPENNIHIVLEAFSRTKTMPLVIIGNWGNNEYGRNLKQKYADSEYVTLLDPIYDIDILFTLRSNAALYVHGHSAGGTNPSLVEAMYLGLAVMAFDVSYNRETTENQALFFGSTEELVAIISRLDESNMADIAMHMKEIADRRYTWSRISGKYAALFGSIRNSVSIH